MSQELGEILLFTAAIFMKLIFEHFTKKAQYYLGEKFARQ